MSLRNTSKAFCSSMLSGYILQLFEGIASSLSSIPWSHFLNGGRAREVSSSNTRQYSRYWSSICCSKVLASFFIFSCIANSVDWVVHRRASSGEGSAMKISSSFSRLFPCVRKCRMPYPESRCCLCSSVRGWSGSVNRTVFLWVISGHVLRWALIAAFGCFRSIHLREREREQDGGHWVNRRRDFLQFMAGLGFFSRVWPRIMSSGPMLVTRNRVTSRCLLTFTAR